MTHELLAQGLGWAEGPTVLPDGRVCFVETYRSQISVWERGRGVNRYAYTAGGPNPVTTDLVGVLSYRTGVNNNDKHFKTSFPYVANPWRGTEIGQ